MLAITLNPPVVPRGIEPRSPGFHSGAYNPFCQSTICLRQVLTDLCFLIIEFTYQQTLRMKKDSNFQPTA
jgi:hypothetical protein